jgi:hypothetical protein
MRSRQQLAVPTKARAIATLALALGMAGAGAGPAAAAPRSTGCDAREGHTLLANTAARFYSTGPARKRRYFVCNYRNNRAKRAAETSARREIKLFGVYDHWLFWIQQMTPAERKVDSTTRYAGVSIWDIRSGRLIAQNPTIGYVWTAAAIGPGGKVAGIADGEGPQGEDPATGRPISPSSAVFIYDPAGVPPGTSGGKLAVPRIVASAPLGTLSNFGVTPDTIVWRAADGVHTAPFAEDPAFLIT